MKSNVPVAQATMHEAVLPERAQETPGQLVGAAKEGLLALSVGAGLELTEFFVARDSRVAGVGRALQTPPRERS